MTSEFDFSDDKYFGYYSVLGVPIKATTEEIKLAYLAHLLAIKRNDETKLNLETLDRAYQVLSNEITRGRHNTALSRVMLERKKKIETDAPSRAEILANEQQKRIKLQQLRKRIFYCVFVLATIYAFWEPIGTFFQKFGYPIHETEVLQKVEPPTPGYETTKEENDDKLMDTPSKPQTQTEKSQPERFVPKATNSTRNQVF